MDPTNGRYTGNQASLSSSDDGEVIVLETQPGKKRPRDSDASSREGGRTSIDNAKDMRQEIFASSSSSESGGAEAQDKHVEYDSMEESGCGGTLVSHEKKWNGNESTTATATAATTPDIEWQKKFESRKSKMSKFASRLFDSDRPRGLVEPPTIIPLSDVYLKEFGRREKEFDVSMGRALEIDRGSLDTVEEDEKESLDGAVAKSGKKRKLVTRDGCKLKVSNLKFTTPKSAIQAEFQKYGKVLEVNLPMDKNRLSLSTGKAWVKFETPEEAAMCMENMNEKNFDGRILRVSVESESKKSGGGNNPGTKPNMLRYWERDISTRCRRCNKVGHLAHACPNEEISRPCAICGVEGHDSRDCTMTCVCFNCGIPGHTSKKCPRQRGLPKRLVCGICFASGHHRWQCQAKSWNVNSLDARCFVCGSLGHFSCREAKWDYKMDGFTCFNCGGRGHHGAGCQRPPLEVCVRDNYELGTREVERAHEWVDSFGHESGQSVEARGRHGRSVSDQSYGRRGNRYASTNGDASRSVRRSQSQPPPLESRGEQSQSMLQGRFQPAPAQSPVRGYHQGRDPRFR